ncbi:MAG: hypothetical protein OEV78_12435 [Spirochaetia bacterium]|nr:hypothetical protein [Spirochaetia bacterium]
MNIVHFIHIFFVGCWLGVVAVEAVIEWRAAKDKQIHVLGKWHYYIDIFVEIPVFSIVLLTGIVMISLINVIDQRIIIKVILGLIPVAVNVWCVYPVVMRKKNIEKGKKPEIQRYSNQIYIAFITGLPFGIAALVYGLMN